MESWSCIRQICLLSARAYAPGHSIPPHLPPLLLLLSLLLFSAAAALLYLQRQRAAARRLSAQNERLRRQTERCTELLRQTVSARRTGEIFLHRIDKELRRPLRSLSDLSQLIRSEALSPAQAEYLQEIDRTVDLLHGILGEISDEAGAALFTGRRVLLAEDNVINAEVSSRLLAKEGIAVAHAHDGRQALEIFQQAPAFTFDLILMDLRMPRMDGCEAARAIRTLSRADAHTIPIIALTADAQPRDVERARAAGMNDHLEKPVSPDRLFSTLRAHLFAEEDAPQ